MGRQEYYLLTYTCRICGYSWKKVVRDYSMGGRDFQSCPKSDCEGKGDLQGATYIGPEGEDREE